MDISPKQKEKINLYLRFFITALCGGVMITFANFTVLVGLADGLVFLAIMILIGLLVGMYSIEIQYAILSGLFSIFFGFIIFYGVIVIPIVIFATWELFDILVMFGVFVIVRIIMLQLIGIMVGTVIGRWIGPAWYEPTLGRHKLKIGVDGKTESGQTE